MDHIPDTEFSFGDDGRFLRAVGTSEVETPAGKFKMELIRDTWGLGLSSVESKGIPGVGLFMFSSTTPIESRRTHSRWLLFSTKGAIDVIGEDWFAGITKGVMDDWQVWTHKIHLANPVFCQNDTPLAEFRRWAKQFYSEPAGG
jgi:hypothetical protein